MLHYRLQPLHLKFKHDPVRTCEAGLTFIGLCSCSESARTRGFRSVFQERVCVCVCCISSGNWAECSWSSTESFLHYTGGVSERLDREERRGESVKKGRKRKDRDGRGGAVTSPQAALSALTHARTRSHTRSHTCSHTCSHSHSVAKAEGRTEGERTSGVNEV